MSFKEPNDPRSSKIGNNQFQLTELATYEEQAPDVSKYIVIWLLSLKYLEYNSLCLVE